LSSIGCSFGSSGIRGIGESVMVEQQNLISELVASSSVKMLSGSGLREI
jgi:hypothetical protein